MNQEQKTSLQMMVQFANHSYWFLQKACDPIFYTVYKYMQDSTHFCTNSLVWKSLASVSIVHEDIAASLEIWDHAILALGLVYDSQRWFSELVTRAIRAQDMGHYPEPKMRGPFAWESESKRITQFKPHTIFPYIHQRMHCFLSGFYPNTWLILQSIMISCCTCFLRARPASAHLILPELGTYGRLFAKIVSTTPLIPVCMALCNVALLRFPWRGGVCLPTHWTWVCLWCALTTIMQRPIPQED